MFEKIENLQIAYIGGGSMNWAWALMGDLALDPQLSGIVKLYDINYDAAKTNEIIGNRLKDDPAVYGDVCSKWEYKAEKTLKDTLTGADFVVISILPGTLDEMDSDVHTPEKYGIYQSVGDTTGPGGIVRAMRAIPMFAEIAEAIKEFSPRAWVINYTNPMSVCTGTLYKVFPGIKAFGCCHEVFHTQEVIAKMLEFEYGLKDINRKEISVNVLGLNHFTWITQVNYKTIDLMPLFGKFAEKYADDGFALYDGDKDKNNSFRNMNKVCFDMFRRYHAIPCAGDRHLAEFMPPWYLKNPETVEKWGFGLTPVSSRKQSRVDKTEILSRIVSGQEKLHIGKSGEEGTEQMKALLGFSELITNVNIPNIGHAEGLPVGAIVETNAVFGKNAVRPVFSGKLPDAVNTIVSKHAVNQQLLIEAGVKKDIELAFNVFLNDNLMTLDIKDAEKLFGEMINNTRKYLQGWDIDKFKR